ncbi:MAG: DUF11 domain-containing protein, partial [Deltaproteobacteria bacterium]
TLENTGTVDAFGLFMTPTLPAGATLEGDGAGVATILGAGGGEGAAIDPTGVPFSGPVSWTRVGDRVVLGAADASAPDGYRRVGLAPGSRAVLHLTVRLPDGLTDGDVFATGATAGTDLRFDADPSLREELLDNNAGGCASFVYRADVFVNKTVVDLTTGSDELARAGDLLGYTVEYGNSGHFAASDVLLEDPLPAGAVFVVGSIADLFTDAVVVEYDDGSQAWTYTPVAETGTPDPQIRAFRVRWRDPLAAPANNVFAQTTAIAFDGDVQDGVESDPQRDAVRPAWPGTHPTDAACAHVRCDSTSRCNYGWVIAEGECCPTCRPDPQCEKPVPDCGTDVCVNTCTYCDESQDSRDWYGDEQACREHVTHALDGWKTCLADHGGSFEACTDREVRDAWTTCGDAPELGFPVSCPDIPLTSCEWTKAIHPILSLYYDLIGLYRSCLEIAGTGEEARCAGLAPSAAVLSCYWEAADATCPSPDVNANCTWNSWAGQNQGAWSHLTWNWTQCRESLGDHPFCSPLELQHPAEACLQRSCPPSAYSCSWDAQNAAAVSVSRQEDSTWRGCLNAYGFDTCAWMEPHDVAAACEAAAAPTGASTACAYKNWSEKVVSDDTGRGDIFRYCLAFAEKAGEDPARCESVAFPMQWPRLMREACPAPDASLAVWLTYGEIVATGFPSRYVDTFKACIAYGDPETCARFLESPAPLQECYRTAPHDTPCALTTSRKGCEQAQDGLETAYTGCLRTAGKDHWQLCAPLATPAVCAGLWEDTCEEAQAAGRADIASVARECWSSQYGIRYALGDCINTIAVPPGVDGFDHALALEACGAGISDLSACGGCDVRCYSDDVAVAHAQADACSYNESEQFHSVWGTCIDQLSWYFRNAGLDVPQAVFDTCAPLKGPKSPCGINSDTCTTTLSVPRIPEDPEETVLSWDRLVATTDPGAGAPVSFTVTDAETGVPLPGLADLDLSAIGVADLSSLSPGDVPAVGLEATFHGGPESCLRFALPSDTLHGTWSAGNHYPQILANDYRDSRSHMIVWTPGNPDVITDLDPLIVALVPNVTSLWANYFSEAGDVLVNVSESGSPNHMILLHPDTPNGTSYHAYEFALDDGRHQVNDLNALGWILWTDPNTASRSRHVSLPDGTGGLRDIELPNPTAYYTLTDSGVLIDNSASDPLLLVPNAPIPTGFDPVALPLPDGASGASLSSVLSNGVVTGSASYPSGPSAPALWWQTSGSWQVETLEGLLGPFASSSPYLQAPRNGAGRHVLVMATHEDDNDLIDLFIVDTGDGPPDTWRFTAFRDLYRMHNNGWAGPGGTALFQSHDDPLWIRVFRFDGTYTDMPHVHLNTTGTVTATGAVIGVSPQSGRPLYWQPDCGSYGAPWLDDWSLLYTTDKHPTFDYQLSVAKVCQTEVTNAVSIATTTPQITDDNDRSSASIAVETANVRVTLTADKGAVLESDALTYTLAWANDGPGVARGAVVTALFGDLFVPDGATGPWPLGDLAPGARGVITVSGTLDAEAFAPNLTLNASAAIETATIDCAPDDDTASAAVATGGFPNLTVAVTGPATLQPGASGAYVVRWTNSGNLSVDSATVTVVVPGDATVGAIGQGGAAADGVITWVVAPLPAGGAGELTFSLAAPGCDAVGSTLRVDAEIAPDDPEVVESSTTDNAASVATRLDGYLGRVDLVGVSDRATAAAGDEVVYTVHWASAGAAGLHGGQLSATLPAGVSFVDGSAPG